MSWRPRLCCGHRPSATRANFQDAFSFCSSSLPSPGQVHKKLQKQWKYLGFCTHTLGDPSVHCSAGDMGHFSSNSPHFQNQEKITKIWIHIQRPSSSAQPHAGSGAEASLASLPTSSLSTGFVSPQGKARSVGVLATSAGANPCHEEHPPQPATC